MQGWIVLGSIAVLLAVLAQGRIKPAVAFTTLAGIYVLTGIVPTDKMLGNYSNPALVTLILLMLVSLALERSQLLDRFADRLMNGSEKRAQLKLMTASAMFSAFLNNTAVVASLLGAISRQRRHASSRLLIPLSYASIFGGITTLVGTSTNLVVSSFAVNAGLPELTMFQFAWVGVPVALLGILVTWWRAQSLPDHAPEDSEARLSYFLAAEVEADSPLAGRSIERNGLRGLDGLYLLEIERDGRLITPVSPGEILEAGDVLVFTGEVQKVQALQRFRGLKLFGNHVDSLLATNLVEVVIANGSELANKTLQDVDFRAMFNAGVVGIRRGNRRLTGQLGRIPLHVGDCLLLATGSDFTQHRNIDRNFHLLSGSFQRPKLTPLQSNATLAGFLIVIALAATGAVPLLHGLLVLLGLLLASRILTVSEMRRRFPFELFLVIGSALTLAEGMEASGAAGLITEGMNHLFRGEGIMAAFVGIYLLTLILTELVTNNAAAALAFPIAWSTAQAFGADPMPFIMAVAFGASACFLVPYGYQTHLMVYSPGRYRMRDYLRTGWPVTIIYSLGVVALTPVVFPF